MVGTFNASVPEMAIDKLSHIFLGHNNLAYLYIYIYQFQIRVVAIDNIYPIDTLSHISYSESWLHSMG